MSLKCALQSVNVLNCKEQRFMSALIADQFVLQEHDNEWKHINYGMNCVPVESERETTLNSGYEREGLSRPSSEWIVTGLSDDRSCTH